VADYGNRLGIPTVNGQFFLTNAIWLPACLLRHDGTDAVEMAQKRKHKPGDLIVLIGGKTGRTAFTALLSPPNN